jgi:hypothetical protein
MAARKKRQDIEEAISISLVLEMVLRMVTMPFSDAIQNVTALLWFWQQVSAGSLSL